MSIQKNREINRRKFMKILLMAGASSAVNWTGLDKLAAAVTNKSDFPIVVIGSGLGGLVSAGFLAKHGFPVTLLERHSIPGGYATSFDRGEGKYTFEVSLHATVAENGTPQRILSKLGVWDKLELAYQPDFCRVIGPDTDIEMPAQDPEKIKQILIANFPKDKAGIESMMDDMVQVQKEMRGYRGKESVMDRLEAITLKQWVDSCLKDPRVKSIMTSFWGYYGLPPSQTNALFYAVATGQYIVYGGQYYKTRSQDLSDTLAKVITDNGGKVILGTGAERINLKQGIVTGVEDDNGKLHPARAVISNASVPVVFNELISPKDVPASYLKKLSGYTPSLSSFVVWLGLNQEMKGDEGYETFIAENSDAEEQYKISLAGDLENAGIAVTFYDNLYKGYSTPGTSSVTIMALCGYESWRKYEKDYMNGEKDAYNEAKEKFAQILIDKTEKYLYPGLNSKIEVIEVGTPLTNKFYTGNPSGEIYGYNRIGGDMMNLDVRTPVKGLYLASAWTHGGGYAPAMMAGITAFEALLEDLDTLS